MLRMNGIKCFEQIRKICEPEMFPVCMFSTAADPSVVAKSKALGGNDLIVKPASLSTRARQSFNSNASLQ